MQGTVAVPTDLIVTSKHLSQTSHSHICEAIAIQEAPHYLRCSTALHSNFSASGTSVIPCSLLTGAHNGNYRTRHDSVTVCMWNFTISPSTRLLFKNFVGLPHSPAPIRHSTFFHKVAAFPSAVVIASQPRPCSTSQDTHHGLPRRSHVLDSLSLGCGRPRQGTAIPVITTQRKPAERSSAAFLFSSGHLMLNICFICVVLFHTRLHTRTCNYSYKKTHPRQYYIPKLHSHIPSIISNADYVH